MLNIIKCAFVCVALLMPVLTHAAPPFLMTHNQTDFESNAYISGVPSIYPTKKKTDNKVYWNMVKLACHGHTQGNLCTAVIKMKTDTPNPVEVGALTLNLLTGDINPKVISGNGFTLVVNGPGETTLTQP